MECGFEGHDRVVGGAGGLVGHGRGDFLGCEVFLGATTLELGVVHESSLVSGFVGVGAGGSGEDLVQALGGNLEETGFEDVCPGAGGEVTQGRSVDQRAHHLGGFGSFKESGIVVSDGDGGDLSVSI